MPGGGVEGGVSGPLVGHNRKLARVSLLLDDALAGRGRLVLCTGEAGVGKTRLAEDCCEGGGAGRAGGVAPGGRCGQFGTVWPVTAGAGRTRRAGRPV